MQSSSLPGASLADQSRISYLSCQAATSLTPHGMTPQPQEKKPWGINTWRLQSAGQDTPRGSYLLQSKTTCAFKIRLAHTQTNGTRQAWWLRFANSISMSSVSMPQAGWPCATVTSWEKTFRYRCSYVDWTSMMTSDSSTHHPPSQTAQSLHFPYQPAPRLHHHLIGSLQLMHHKQWMPQQLLLPDPTNVNPMFSTPFHMYTSHGPSKIPTLQRLWSHWYLQAQLHPLH